jgi:general secretion pathway protein C
MIEILLDNLKRYFYFVHFALVTLCAFFASQIVADFIAHRIGPLDVERGAPFEEPAESPRSAARTVSKSAYNSIIDRNIFNSQATGLEGIPGEIPENLPPTPLQAQLLGTIVGPADYPEYSFAVIEDKVAKETSVYHVNDLVQNQARIIQIERNRVVIYRDGRQESLLLFEQETPTVASSTSTSSKESGSVQVREVGEGTYEVSRQEFESATNNMGTLLTQARIVPNLSEGQVDGYKVFAIKKGSLYEKIGLQNGDVIKNINGINISSPEKALQLFQDLRNESAFAVELTRNGQPMTLNYSIR